MVGDEPGVWWIIYRFPFEVLLSCKFWSRGHIHATPTSECDNARSSYPWSLTTTDRLSSSSGSRRSCVFSWAFTSLCKQSFNPSLVVSHCFIESSNIHYFGSSYLEFEGFELEAINTMTVSFQSQAAQGTIIYVDQGPANGDFFFMKLFILDGVLQVQHIPSCAFFFPETRLLSLVDLLLNFLQSFSMHSAAMKRKRSHWSVRLSQLMMVMSIL